MLTTAGKIAASISVVSRRVLISSSTLRTKHTSIRGAPRIPQRKTSIPQIKPSNHSTSKAPKDSQIEEDRGVEDGISLPNGSPALPEPQTPPISSAPLEGRLTKSADDPLLEFYVNGTMYDLKDKFFVKPNNEALIASINKMGYVMFTGHRGSGKSTRCWYAVHKELPRKYQVLWTSLQAVIGAKTPEQFWRKFGMHIKDKCRFWKQDQEAITDAATFERFFAYHKNKRIVLVIDELDRLLSLPEAQAELYDALRAMREERPKTYGLQSVIGIGPFTIMGLPSDQELSPFNVTEHHTAPYFTELEVIQLFEDYQQTYHVSLAPGIAKRVFNITSGHPAMVCYCGKQIQTREILSLEVWMEYETFELYKEISTGWRTVTVLSSRVKDPQYSDFLSRGILSRSVGAAYDPESDVQLALIGLGALALKKGRVEVPSPLHRIILLMSILSKQYRHIGLTPVATVTGSLDVPALVRFVEHFDANRMRAAVLGANKKNETGYKGMVPHENTYLFELLRLLVPSLPDGFSVDPGLNAPNSKRTDVTVTSPQGKRVVLEIVAHEHDGPETRKGSVLEHIRRCEHTYSKIKDVAELWVINFTTKRPNKSNDRGYVWPANDSVNIIHVWHDLAWKQAKITERVGKNGVYEFSTTDVRLA